LSIDTDKTMTYNSGVDRCQILVSKYKELLRVMIIKRTQEGKAIAKEKEGFTESRPKKYSSQQTNHALELLEDNSLCHTEKQNFAGKLHRQEVHHHRTGYPVDYLLIQYHQGHPSGCRNEAAGKKQAEALQI